MKRIISLLLCSALLLSSVTFAASAPASAMSGSDLSTARGVYFHSKYYEPICYSDDYFRSDSRVFNIHLANTSFEAVLASSSSKDYIRAFLEDNGFEDFDVNQDFKEDTSIDSMCVAFAHKKIVQNGKEYTLIAVIPRGGTRTLEWDKNVMISDHPGDTGNYAGMEFCSKKVISSAKEYISGCGISGDVKLWIAGYSRTSSVMNLAAAEILKYPKRSLGSGIRLAPENMYCYNNAIYRAAAKKNLDRDNANAGYDFRGIHNISDQTDIAVHLPPDSFDFGMYGQVYPLSESEYRERMLQLIKLHSESEYEKFIASEDPEDFAPYKLDTEAILNGGGPAFVEDDDSYLPADQAEYEESIERYLDSFFARSSSSGNSRDGYASDYQEPARRFFASLMKGALGDISGEGGSLDLSGMFSVPLLISMYVSFVAGKIDAERSLSANQAIEGAFNTLAYLIEDPEGNVRPQYRGFADAYDRIRSSWFVPSSSQEQPAEAVQDPDTEVPQKYKLKKSVNSDSRLFLELSRNLSAYLYADSVSKSMREKGVDEETIAEMTSYEDSYAMSYLIANLILGNGLQDKASFNDFSLDNQYFKQAATFVGNSARFFSYHMKTAIRGFMRAKDSYFDNYAPLTDVQKTGYRRVYIKAPAGTDVSGTVRDGSGNTAAAFRNGKLTSRSDEWIGITACSTGDWLRLPADKDYKVYIDVSRASSLSLAVGDYSVDERAVIRSVSSDNRYNWTGLAAEASDTLVLNIPAAAETEEGYDLTGSYYSLEVNQGSGPDVKPASDKSDESDISGKGIPSDGSNESVIVSKKLPSLRSFIAKASKGSFTVKWKKLSASKRKKISGVELQYGTDKSFAKDATKIKKLGKSKKSCRIKKLKKNRGYYVRVRTVRYSGGKKYVSKWSAVRKVRIK